MATLESDHGTRKVVVSGRYYSSGLWQELNDALANYHDLRDEQAREEFKARFPDFAEISDLALGRIKFVKRRRDRLIVILRT